MRKSLWMVGLLLAVGCGGTSTLRVRMTSGDAGADVGTLKQSQTSPGALANAKSVKVTVSEISVHVAPDDATVSAARADDDRGGWHVITKDEQTIDLVSLRGQPTGEEVGEYEVPAGWMTQLRLALKAPESRDGSGVITGAVVDADGRTCDLIIPQSAVNPGVKVNGALDLVAGGVEDVVVDLSLHDSKREDTASGCAYRLNPVIRLATPIAQ